MNVFHFLNTMGVNRLIPIEQEYSIEKFVGGVVLTELQ